jgi:hypothetical protein
VLSPTAGLQRCWVQKLKISDLLQKRVSEPKTQPWCCVHTPRVRKWQKSRVFKFSLFSRFSRLFEGFGQKPLSRTGGPPNGAGRKNSNFQICDKNASPSPKPNSGAVYTHPGCENVKKVDFSKFQFFLDFLDFLSVFAKTR